MQAIVNIQIEIRIWYGTGSQSENYYQNHP